MNFKFYELLRFITIKHNIFFIKRIKAIYYFVKINKLLKIAVLFFSYKKDKFRYVVL